MIIDNLTGEVIEEKENKNEIALMKAQEIIDFDKLDELYEAMDIAEANLKNYINEFEKKLLDILRTLPDGEQKIESEYRTFSRRKGYLKDTFDSKKFKKDYPELYQRYVSKTAINESLVIRERK